MPLLDIIHRFRAKSQVQRVGFCFGIGNIQYRVALLLGRLPEMVQSIDDTRYDEEDPK